MKGFLTWIFTLCLILYGLGFLLVSGMFQRINDGDVTKLSFCILAVFMLFTARVGKHQWVLYRKGNSEPEVERLQRRQGSSWFVADLLFSVGLVGTVIGFIYMLYMMFGALEMGGVTPLALQAGMVGMGKGMSSALYTTAAGMICGIILRIQLALLEIDLNRAVRKLNAGG